MNRLMALLLSAFAVIGLVMACVLFGWGCTKQPTFGAAPRAVPSVINTPNGGKAVLNEMTGPGINIVVIDFTNYLDASPGVIWTFPTPFSAPPTITGNLVPAINVPTATQVVLPHGPKPISGRLIFMGGEAS